MRRILIILIVVVALGAGGWWVYQNYFAETEEPVVEREEATVKAGTLTALVNATGTMLPESQTTLSFKSPGRVDQVLVEEGQGVRADEVLAQLETTDLAFAIDQAEIAAAQAEMSVDLAAVGLASAQAQLLKAQQDAAEYDLAAAQSAVDSARATYRRLVSGPTAEEKRVARASLDQAEASRDQAQAAYDQVADRADVAMLPQSLQLEQATSAYEVAKANYELTMRPASNADLTAARSAIIQAEASLARLLEGISDEDLLVAQLGVEQAHIGVDQAQIGVDQAQLSLDQALHGLEGTVLAAPHTGKITMVGIKEGELTGGQPAFILTDLSEYHVDVTVDEIDIGRVAEGQPVTVTLDALPGELLTGWVDTIADTAEFDTGVVSYKVTVRIDPSNAPLRVGMTANVDIVTERRDGVLLVPNRFVRIDRTTGQAFVDKLVGGEIVSTEIQIGLRDETFSEVLAGLEEGDVVVLVKESSREQLRRVMQGPPQ